MLKRSKSAAKRRLDPLEFRASPFCPFAFHFHFHFRSLEAELSAVCYPAVRPDDFAAYRF